MFEFVLSQARYLGYFATEESAAYMYDRAAIGVRGPEASLNFPRQLYDSTGLPNGWMSSEDQLQSVLRNFKDDHNAAPRYCIHPGCIDSYVTCSWGASMQHTQSVSVACPHACLQSFLHADDNKSMRTHL